MAYVNGIQVPDTGNNSRHIKVSKGKEQKIWQHEFPQTLGVKTKCSEIVSIHLVKSRHLRVKHNHEQRQILMNVVYHVQ